MNPKNFRGFVWLPFLLGAFAILVIGGSTYLWQTGKLTVKTAPSPQTDCAAMHLPPDCNTDAKTNPSPTQTNTSATNQTQPVTSAPTDWKTYTNVQYGFSLQYPEDKVRVALMGTSVEFYSPVQSDLATLEVRVNELKNCGPYSDSVNGYGPLGQIKLGQDSFLKADVSVEYNGMNTSPPGWYVLGYCLAKGGTVYELRDRSGGKDSVIQQVLQTFKFTSTASSNTSISGMNKYTDSDFGFSFWYPSGWTIEPTYYGADIPGSNRYAIPGGVIAKALVVHTTKPEQSFVVEEFSSPTRAISDSASYCSIGADDGRTCGYVRFYFDVDTHTWMMELPAAIGHNGKDGTPYTIATTTQAADVSVNTMGGLHMLSGGDSHHQDIIVPLSAENFVVVSGIYTSNAAFAKTIVAADSSVATPVSQAEQIATIKAEAAAYAK